MISIVMFVIALLGGCGKGSVPDGAQDNDSPVEYKSAKRGIAYDLKNAADLDSLSRGVSWWYNWYFTTAAPAGYYQSYDMEFIPMLWGRNGFPDFVQAQSFIASRPEVRYLLVMNEPNLTDQANLTPAQAATEWLSYEQLAKEFATQGRSISIVGPALTWGTMPGYADPVVWLDAFYAEYRAANGGKDPVIDYLAFHWYDYGLDAQLDRLAKYGKKIWVTEMSNWNPNITSYELQAAQMEQMVALCESREDVFRYAWFIGRGSFPDSKFTYLFDQEPGALNRLGQFYLSLPFNE